RLAKLANSPFLKVEASKFTEGGYVGRDVESMIHNLVEIAIDMVRTEKIEEIAEKTEQNAEKRNLDLLLPTLSPAPIVSDDSSKSATENWNRTREKLRNQLRDGKLNERTIKLEIKKQSFPTFKIISSSGVEEMDINIKDILPGFLGQKT